VKGSHYNNTVLHVTVCQARGLLILESDYSYSGGSGAGDPYAIVTHGMQEESTAVIPKSTAPVWNLTKRFNFRVLERLVVRLYDRVLIITIYGRITLDSTPEVRLYDRGEMSFDGDDFLGKVEVILLHSIYSTYLHVWY